MAEIQPIDPVVPELTQEDERRKYWGSDPAPFDIDGYVNDWNATNPIEAQADRRASFTNVVHKISRPFLAQGYNGAAAVNRGLAGFSAHLDSIADFISISTGTKKGGVFEDAAKLYEENADYWRKRAEDVGIGFVDELVSEAVGGFVPGVTQFSLDVASGFTFPYMAGAAEAAKRDESPFLAGMLEAAKTGTLAALFRAMAPLKKYLQAPTMGTVFGLQEMEAAPPGQKARGFAKGVGIGVGYSLVTPGGRMGLKEIKRGIEPDLKAARDALPSLGEQRGTFAGEKAIGAPDGKLRKAQDSINKGEERSKVWKETGWLKGVEGKWKFEIDDSKARYKPEALLRLGKTNDIKLGELLDHPELFKAYPELKDIDVRMTPGTKNSSYQESKNLIKLGGGIDALMHEVQHAIQTKEGFASGGNPRQFEWSQKYFIDGKETSDMEGGRGVILRHWDDNESLTGLDKVFKKTLGQWKQRLKNAKRKSTIDEYKEKVSEWEEAIRLLPEAKNWKIEKKSQAVKEYKRLGGEIESREVQARMDMTEAERQANFPEYEGGRKINGS